MEREGQAFFLGGGEILMGIIILLNVCVCSCGLDIVSVSVCISVSVSVCVGRSNVSHTWCVTSETASGSGSHRTIQYQVCTETSHMTDFKPPSATYTQAHMNRKHTLTSHLNLQVYTDSHLLTLAE